MDRRSSPPPPSPPALIAERPEPCATLLLEAENTSLRSLVHHRHFVEQNLPMEQTQREFSEKGVDYLALVRDGLVVGLCSRLSLGILLGARFGFALHSRSPATSPKSSTRWCFPPRLPCVRRWIVRLLAAATNFTKTWCLWTSSTTSSG